MIEKSSFFVVGKVAIDILNIIKERLEHIQNVMREKCIDTFNKYFEKENATLKTKERGRNKDINVKDMVNYQELKKELEINKALSTINREMDEAAEEFFQANKKDDYYL